MIGAVCFKVSSEYEARIYMVGTYNQIDWENTSPCDLGTDYSCYFYKKKNGSDAINIVKGLDDHYVLRLKETKRYVVRLINSPSAGGELIHIQNENNNFLKLDRDENSVTFQFINYLGRSKITFGQGDTKRQCLFEVVPDKMSYEEDYIALTESLAQVCSELLLEYSGATSNLYSQAEGTGKIVLEQFIFLRQFCYNQNLFSLFASIKRNPDRLLNSDEELKPTGYGVLSAKFYTNPFSYSRGWQKVKRDGNKSVFIPQKVSVIQKYDSLDTPANRFVKYALEKFNMVCVELIRILSSTNNVKQAECLLEAKIFHDMIDEILLDGFFDEIGKLDIMPQNNQVLQKREGYSQIFFAYSMIDLALQLDWRGKDKIYDGESKNVALLYEYWLFFELYKIVSSIEGCKATEQKDNNFLTVRDGGMTISLEEGKTSRQSFVIERLHTKINLYYNRTFSSTDFKATMYEGSYSRPFRPDYTIAVFPDMYKGRNNGEDDAVKEGAVSYIHFDAKYRITELTSLIGKNTKAVEDEEIIEDKTNAVINTYKRGDLLKMHTYNDAIRRTIGSYILYPGTDNLTEDKGKFRLYDEILPGVGAFAIRPGISAEGENELKRFITFFLESKKAANSRLNRMNHYMEMVLREPAVSSLKIINTTEKEETALGTDKGERCVLGYIRGGKDEDYYFSLRDNNLLVKDAEFLFYFYAIKGTNVYSHHQDVFKATDFCFYTNAINETNTYKTEPVLCKIVSNELLSKEELVERLKKQGYDTNADRHNADFYYVLKVKVVDDHCSIMEMDVSKINAQNGNDTFSPHSPKVVLWKEQ